MHRDKFRTGATTDDYREGWNRIFGKKKVTDVPWDRYDVEESEAVRESDEEINAAIRDSEE
jgi:hypothetical protein